MSIYRALLKGAIIKDKGNGHWFYDALDYATVDDLQRAQKRLERYGRYPGSHQAKRLAAIKTKLADIIAAWTTA